jgi:hypothetical protein
MPGMTKNVSQGMGIFRGSVKGGRPPSAREFGFRWIDLAGSILVPLAVVGVVAHAVLRKVVKE